MSSDKIFLLRPFIMPRKEEDKMFIESIKGLASVYKNCEKRGDNLTLNNFDEIVINSMHHTIKYGVVISGVVQ